MIFRIERDEVRIEPEDDMDIAYIEDTLGLVRAGQSVQLVREDEPENATAGFSMGSKTTVRHLVARRRGVG